MDFVSSGVARDRTYETCPVLGERFAWPAQYGGNECNATVLWLVLNGADLDAEFNSVQLTPLISAVRRGDVVGLRVLLEAGANPNSVDRDGRTALHYAVEDMCDEDDGEPIRVLLHAGADATIEDCDGDTPADINFVDLDEFRR